MNLVAQAPTRSVRLVLQPIDTNTSFRNQAYAMLKQAS